MRLIIRIYAPLPSTGLLEDSRRLEKERVALRGALAERGSASLVGHLDRPERRQISVHEYGLRVLAIDSRVGLKEHPQEQIFRRTGQIEERESTSLLVQDQGRAPGARA